MTQTPMRFRKKPVEIEALRFDGTNYDDVAEWVGDAVPTDEHKITIRTLEGDIFASPGDWIIRGVGSRRPVRLPSSGFIGLDSMAVSASDYAGMSFDLIKNSSDRFGVTDVDRLTIHMVNVEGHVGLAVSTIDTSSLKFVRSEPCLDLTDACSSLGVFFLTVSGLLQTLPSPLSTLFTTGLWSGWTCPALAQTGTEFCVPSSRLEVGAALSADEFMSHEWILPDFYPCKPDIFEATYEPVEAVTVSVPDPSPFPFIKLFRGLRLR